MGWEWMGEQKDAGAEKLPARRDPGVRAGARVMYLGTCVQRIPAGHDVHCPANLSEHLAPTSGSTKHGSKSNNHPVSPKDSGLSEKAPLAYSVCLIGFLRILDIYQGVYSNSHHGLARCSAGKSKLTAVLHFPPVLLVVSHITKHFIQHEYVSPLKQRNIT